MLAALGVATLDELIDQAVPKTDPHRPAAASSPDARSEPEVLATLRALADRNQVVTSLIGHGLLRHPHPGRDPAQRAREPGLVHGLHAVPARDQPGPARGAPQLPDDGHGPHRAWRSPTRRCSTSRTAAAEAMTLVRRSTRHAAHVFFVDAETHPQTIAVVAARAEPIGIEVVVGDLATDLVPRRRLRRAAAAPRHHRASSATSPPPSPRCTRPAAWSSSPPTCWPARCSPRRASRAPTCASARRSASACRSATADRTPGSSPPATSSAGRCPAASSACRSTPPAAPPTAWPCRPASSTSAARRRRPTSAPPRCCWP